MRISSSLSSRHWPAKHRFPRNPPRCDAARAGTRRESRDPSNSLTSLASKTLTRSPPSGNSHSPEHRQCPCSAVEPLGPVFLDVEAAPLPPHSCHGGCDGGGRYRLFLVAQYPDFYHFSSSCCCFFFLP
ncbi:hypothetical protein V8C44DRAFT_169382 [Trichoderma aethiopicum]